MATTQTAVFSLLKDTFETVWGVKFPANDTKKAWKRIYTEKTTKDPYVDDQEIVGPGLASRKGQGNVMLLDSVVEGVAKRYDIKTYALKLEISEEVVEDNKYERAVSWTNMLAESIAQTPAYDAANVLNRAFTTGYVGGDAVVLCSTSHPLTRGGTYSNRLATDASLTETALEDMNAALRVMVGSHGLPVGYETEALVVPAGLEATATRILKSSLQNDTANNAINASRAMGMFPKGIVVLPQFTSSTAYWATTSAPNGLTWYWRRKPRFRQANDEQRMVLICMADYRADWGWTDPRGVFAGSA